MIVPSTAREEQPRWPCRPALGDDVLVVGAGKEAGLRRRVVRGIRFRSGVEHSALVDRRWGVLGVRHAVGEAALLAGPTSGFKRPGS
ncbi:hypothetical protein ADK64_00825 [Streptomyces sp. MMG1121]|nr:hypothetical protein ADK64_00825 [Streptomyces sp. MMG1121]